MGPLAPLLLGLPQGPTTPALVRPRWVSQEAPPLMSTPTTAQSSPAWRFTQTPWAMIAPPQTPTPPCTGTSPTMTQAHPPQWALSSSKRDPPKLSVKQPKWRWMNEESLFTTSVVWNRGVTPPPQPSRTAVNPSTRLTPRWMSPSMTAHQPVLPALPQPQVNPANLPARPSPPHPLIPYRGPCSPPSKWIPSPLVGMRSLPKPVHHLVGWCC